MPCREPHAWFVNMKRVFSVIFVRFFYSDIMLGIGIYEDAMDGHLYDNERELDWVIRKRDALQTVHPYSECYVKSFVRGISSKALFFFNDGYRQGS